MSRQSDKAMLEARLHKLQQLCAEQQRTIELLQDLGAEIVAIGNRDILGEGGSPFEIYRKKLQDVVNIGYRIKAAQVV